jgi:hypothetical protein
LIDCCVEHGDFSPLAPMSRKDLIWVQVAQKIKKEQEYEKEKSYMELENRKFQHISVMLADIQTILLDSNGYTRAIAFKDSKKRKIDPFDVTLLPSHVAQKEREQKEYEERRAKMTDEERQEEDIKNFLAGKKYKPNG